MKKIITLTLFLLTIIGCKSEAAGNNRDQNDLIAAVAIRRFSENSTDTVERRNCIEAVLVMNQCVGAGLGFSAGTMCAPSYMTSLTFTAPTTITSAYASLVTCVRDKVVTYNCNFSQNKVSTAQSALTSYFSACNVPAGIINTSLY